MPADTRSQPSRKPAIKGKNSFFDCSVRAAGNQSWRRWRYVENSLPPSPSRPFRSSMPSSEEKNPEKGLDRLC